MQCTPNELGREQFFNFESKGIVPEIPDVFFKQLCDGKKWFSVQQETIRKSYLTEEWAGFYSYYVDFKGERFILKYLFSWLKEVPKWIFEE